jgi:hypothetical protein
MKESALLTAGNIVYIKNTLSNEREKLLKEINVRHAIRSWTIKKKNSKKNSKKSKIKIVNTSKKP